MQASGLELKQHDSEQKLPMRHLMKPIAIPALRGKYSVEV
jgi:hypothetical protein